jgi:hypothetical protein
VEALAGVSIDLFSGRPVSADAHHAAVQARVEIAIDHRSAAGLADAASTEPGISIGAYETATPAVTGSDRSSTEDPATDVQPAGASVAAYGV